MKFLPAGESKGIDDCVCMDNSAILPGIPKVSATALKGAHWTKALAFAILAGHCHYVLSSSRADDGLQ